MHVVYEPEDPAEGDRHEWSFVPGRVRADEAELLEKEFGGTWDEFQAGVQQGSMRARRIMLWHLLRLTHPGMNFRDVPNFLSDELMVEYSVKELTKLRDGVQKANMPAGRREQVLTAIDLEMTKAMEREAEAGPGKAPSTTSSTNTG